MNPNTDSMQQVGASPHRVAQDLQNLLPLAETVWHITKADGDFGAWKASSMLGALQCSVMQGFYDLTV